MGYWDDYIAHRPGTMGGEVARAEFRRSIAPPHYSTPALPDLPAGPEERVSRPPRKARPMTARDLLIGLVLGLVAWAALNRSGAGSGAGWLALFIGMVASKWWRELLVLGIVGGGLVWLFARAK